MWNISLPDFRIQYVTLLKSGIHTMYCIKWKMTILFLTYRFKIVIFICLIFKDYSIFCIDIYNILFFFPPKQYNNMLCFGTVNYVYIYIYLYMFCVYTQNKLRNEIVMSQFIDMDYCFLSTTN